MTTNELPPSTATTNRALPRRFLRSFLLLALQRDGASHGYGLFECVTARGLTVDMAGVYRDLRTMEQHDLVTSEWAPSDSGPDRRIYDLTKEGRLAAIEAADELASIRDGLAAALDDFTLVNAQTSVHAE
jgi:PadR family transcriptional regulator PadR